MKNSRIKLFISYAHKDENFKNEFVNHISGLKRNGMIEEWNDRQILPSSKWDNEIKTKLDQSEIVIFLISSDFMASDYINDVEIQNTLKRCSKNQVYIIPIIIRPCDFRSLELSNFQALPKDAIPISKWDDRDEAWLNVVDGLKRVIDAKEYSLPKENELEENIFIPKEEETRTVIQNGEKSLCIEK